MKIFRAFSLFLATVFCVSCLVGTAFAAPVPEDAPDIKCGSCLLADMESDTVLYGVKNSKKIYPASVTKILTALVVLRHIDAGTLSMDTVVTISKDIKKGLTDEAAVAHLQPGEEVSIWDLMHMMLISSHCDASTALAEAASGSVEAFADEMNAEAKALGCTKTHFVNPHGLHNKDHYTSCNDLYLISKAAYEYEDFRTIIKKRSYTVPATNLHEKRKLRNTNRLIQKKDKEEYYYKYCVGGKTGSTFNAQYCVISFAEKKGQTLCCVMMGCEWLLDNHNDKIWVQFIYSKKLYEWAFATFKKKELLSAGQEIETLPVTGARDNSTVTALTADSLSALVRKSSSPEDCELVTDLPESVEAPVKAGDTLGTVTVLLDGETIGTVPLTASDSVKRLPLILPRLDHFSHEPRPNHTGTYLAAGACGLGAVLLLLWRFLRRRSSGSHSDS